MGNTTTVPRQERRFRWGLVAGMLAAATVSAAALTAAGPAIPAGARSHDSKAHKSTVHVSTAKVPHVGTVLTTGAGITLYHFEKDPPGKATCTGACAKIWPPYFASKEAHVKGPKGVKGLSVVNVGGGHWQVAFDHLPLYRFEGDKKKGQAKGQGFAGVWFVALKSGIPPMLHVPPATPTPATPTPAPASPTTLPATPTTQPPPATTTPAGPAPTTPATAPPMTTPPTAPPPPPTTLPPTTTTTAAPSGGGVSF
jgi:predicted lipoprotein with Yx(FWY)xxD motif